MTTYPDQPSTRPSRRGASTKAESPFPHLLSPFTLRGRTLRNRVVHASMSTCFGGGGQVNQRLLDYTEARARGGAAMMVTGALAGLESQAGGYRVHAFSDDHLDALKRWAAAGEAHDCRMLGQLMAPGRARHHPGRADNAVAPSALPDDLSWTAPHALSVGEIQRMVDEFARTSNRLQRAGFSGVELSGAHGHLFHQFMSPWSNRREDAYGGDLQGRLRLIRELVAAIRAACNGDLIIGLKVPGDDGVRGGIGPEQSAEIVRHLAAHCDLDYFCPAQGSHHRSLEMHTPDMHFPRTPYVAITRSVRAAADKVAVVALGRITEPSQAERILGEGTADLVMLGRTLVADAAWVAKAADGHEDEIRTCLSCNTCWGEITEHRPMSCVANPRLGTSDEATWKPQRARKRRNVVVVGSGVAGLEAAWVAAARGHRVTLFGASPEVGGELRLHATLPGCDSLANLYAFQYPAALRAGVHFELGVRVNAQEVLERQPDVVVLATGSRMSWPVTLPEDLREQGVVPDLRASVRTVLGFKGHDSGTAVIYDHDHTAGTYAAAELFHERFGRVVLLTPREQIARDEPLVTQQGIYRRLYEKRIEIVLLAEPLADSQLIEGRVSYANVFNGDRGEISDVALLTYATQRVPSLELSEPLAAAGIEVRLVGDCYAPRGMLAATREGHATGNEL